MLAFFDQSARDAASLRTVLSTAASGATNVAAQRERNAARDHVETQRVAMQALFKDAIITNFWRDAQPDKNRLVMLRDELTLAFSSPWTVGILADAFESSELTEALLADILASPQLKLSGPQQVLFATSLCYAVNEGNRMMARKWLQKRVAEVTDSSSAESFIAAVRGSEDRTSDVTLRQLLSLTASDASFAQFYRFITANLNLSKAPLPALDAALPDGMPTCVVPLSAVMEDLGPSCVATIDDARELLALYPAPITPKVVADCILVMMHTGKAEPNTWWRIQKTAEATTVRTQADDASSGASSWNAINFTQAVREIAASLDWASVIAQLDQTACSTEPNKIMVALGAYRIANNTLAPAALLLKPWVRAPAAQLQVLRTLAANPDAVDRRELVALPTTLGPRDGSAAADFTVMWMHPAFVIALVDCGAVGGAPVAQATTAMILAAAKVAPAAIVASLLSSPATRTSRSVRLAMDLIQAHGVDACLPSESIAYFMSNGHLNTMLTLIAQYVAADHGRAASVHTLLQSGRFFDKILTVASDPAVHVLFAISGQECGQIPTNYIADALGANQANNGNSAARPAAPLNLPVSRVALAMAAVEVCDDLISKGSTVSTAIRTALTAVTNSGLSLIIPNVVAHAKSLMSAANAFGNHEDDVATPPTFPPDIEKTATEFVETVCRNPDPEGLAEIRRVLGLREGGSERERLMIACICRTMLDEAACVNQYPPSALANFSRFFGQLVQFDLFQGSDMRFALRITLQSVVNPSDPRMREFGSRALEVFKQRVVEWPAFRRSLRLAPDLDMYVPGIMALLNSADREDAAKAAAEGGATGAPAADAPKKAGPDSSGAISALHQHDIRALTDGIATVAPSSVVQDRINFLVGNTDTDSEKTEAHAAELRSLLRPEFYAHFAEYLVVKRVALEPNNHKTYLALIERLGSPDLDSKIRRATLTACKRLFQSDKVCTNSSERSLLKNLGSWLGQITFAKNIPILGRDLDLRELVPQALMEGKLIAVVPFLAKVMEHATSRAFRIPNPLIMCLLGQLAEMYRLDDLKITLRFEVEVLCRNLGIQINELLEYVKERPGRAMLDDLKRRFVDVQNSFDFRPSQEEADAPRTKLTATAPPYEPKAQDPSSQMRPIVHAGQLSLPELHIGHEAAAMNPQQLLHYRQVLHAAFDRGLQDCQQVLDRSIQIACSTTREIVAKDFSREPDDQHLPGAAHAMARNLATNLVNVTTRDAAVTLCRKQLHGILPSLFGPDGVPERADALLTMNYAAIMAVLEDATTQITARHMDAEIATVIEQRRMAFARGEVFPRDNIRSVATINALSALPEGLRPGRLHQHHLAVYFQFAPQRPEASVEGVVGLLQQIEDAALRHYTECPPGANPVNVLSLTNVSFTETTQSEHHDFIKKKLVEVSHWITEVNAVPLLLHLFPRIMALAEKVQLDMRGNVSIHHVNLLLNEVCLFVLQAIREKGQGKAVAELTRLYLAHEKRWHNRDLATNLVRLRVIDISEFDNALMLSLKDSHNRQTAVEFAGHLVQRCLIDEKLIASKDLRRTLEVLEKIAEASKRQRLPMKVRVPTNHTPVDRDAVEKYFVEWMGICDKKPGAPAPPAPAAAPAPAAGAAAAPVAPGAPAAPGVAAGTAPPAAAEAPVNQQQTKQMIALAFVKKLQDNGMLKAESMLDKFFGILTELAVEDYATQVLQYERALPPDQRPQSQGPDIQRGQVQPPPSRVSGDPKFFAAVDAFSDLVVVLVKCCSWSNTKRPDENRQQGAAESALITRVLHVVARSLQHNHDFFINVAHDAHPDLPEGFVLQDQFMQQPYMRFFSNLMISLSTMHQDEKPEYFLLIANALHATNPQRLPGFAFAWIELICHRLFIGRLLKHASGWNPFYKLLNDALRFVEPFARPNEMSPALILYFKCVLKLMLLLLHDFAEFLLAYHQLLCDAIPLCCVQMRNIVLSAFPRDTKLPDPFARGFKYNQLPQIREAPTMVPVVANPFGQTFCGIVCSLNKEDFDKFINTGVPADIPEQIASRVTVRQDSTGRPVPGYNVPMLSALILYSCIGTLHRQQAQILAAVQAGADTDAAVFNANLPAAELLRTLMARFNSEGRYHVINSCVNHLRFPNSHTHYFSLALQQLFRHPCPHQESVQEIITRVLVERLIISRPHPWGLLITFFDIVKDQQNGFWDKPFIRCTPEIERMFESVAQSVNPTVQAQATTPAPAAPVAPGAAAAPRRA